MKKTFSTLFMLAFFFAMHASEAVTVRLSDGISDASTKAKMESLMSTLLTDANAANEAKRNLNYAMLHLNTEVQRKLSLLWENSPFICLDTEVVEHCLTTSNGYQIRNIPIQLTEAEEDDAYKEAVINFDKNGNMTSFNLAIDMNLYMSVLQSNLEVTDLRRRQLVLDFVEQFRTAYNQKDLPFLQQIFSEDALIITGTVIKQSKDGVPLPPKITLNKQTKQQYLTKLKGVFNQNKRIRVTFDEIEVMRHPVDVNVYGVTLHQGWTSDRYSDDGYVFLLWDFQDEDHPQIHVRTWQPSRYSTDGKTGERVPREEIFSLSDFDI